MAHQFVVNATIKGVSLDDFRRLAANISLHENVCRRIPGEKLEILESNKVGDIYTLKRAYNLDVNIPDIAKKFLKDAFRLQRTDVSNLVVLSSEVRLDPNLPLEAVCQRSVSGNDEQIHFQLEWTVKVSMIMDNIGIKVNNTSKIKSTTKITL